MNLGRRKELSAFLPFAHGEISQEILVNLSLDVALAIMGMEFISRPGQGGVTQAVIAKHLSDQDFRP